MLEMRWAIAALLILSGCASPSPAKKMAEAVTYYAQCHLDDCGKNPNGGKR